METVTPKNTVSTGIINNPVAAGFAGLAAGNQFGMALADAGGITGSAQFDQQTFEFNATLAEMAGTEALRRGEVDVTASQQKTTQMLANQRVSLAASGIDIGSGTAAALQRDTEDVGAENVRRIRNNAWLQAWGYQVEAVNDRNKGNMEVTAANNKARSTILGGILKGVSSIGTGLAGAK